MSRVHLVVALLVACSPASEPQHDGAETPSTTAAVTAPVQTVEIPTAPSSAATPSAIPAAPSASAVAIPLQCQKDTQCRWDDGCFPTACVPGQRELRNCDESAPEPGACKCLAGACAVIYKNTSGRCNSDKECSWDDPCNPNQCRRAPAPALVGCEKSRPAPGACLCVDHVCASVAPPKR